MLGNFAPLFRKKNQLVFFYTGNASATFDPTITTSQSTDIYWAPDDGPVTKTTGTSHAFSYVPGAGSHRCKVKVNLSQVTKIDCNDDAITNIQNLNKLLSLQYYWIYNNSGYAISLSQIPRSVIDIRATATGVYGDINNIPPNAIYVNFQSNSGITGSASTIPANIQTGIFTSCPNLTFDSIAQLVDVRDIRFASCSLSQAQSNAIVDSIYQAVLLDANHFTYATPALNISGASNAAPSGTYQYAANPSTGLEKVYYLCHLAAHAWTISWNGGSGP